MTLPPRIAGCCERGVAEIPEHQREARELFRHPRRVKLALPGKPGSLRGARQDRPESRLIPLDAHQAPGNVPAAAVDQRANPGQLPGLRHAHRGTRSARSPRRPP
jgi:hypothetical protein